LCIAAKAFVNSLKASAEQQVLRAIGICRCGFGRDSDADHLLTSSAGYLNKTEGTYHLSIQI